MRPRTNPIPSAVKTALVGFSRTYCSASSWNVRARPRASSHTSSAFPRASPQACSALPRYSPAIEPAADRKSSAALRACVLLLSSLLCASVIPCLFSSAIGFLQLISLQYPRADRFQQTPEQINPLEMETQSRQQARLLGDYLRPSAIVVQASAAPTTARER